jgi:hypothetical protein
LNFSRHFRTDHEKICISFQSQHFRVHHNLNIDHILESSSALGFCAADAALAAHCVSVLSVLVALHLHSVPNSINIEELDVARALPRGKLMPTLGHSA